MMTEQEFAQEAVGGLFSLLAVSDLLLALLLGVSIILIIAVWRNR